jgi:hypothetical protein
MPEDNPREWSLLRQHLEASKIHKRLISGGPHETLSERFMRNVLAQQFGIKPGEVTWQQITEAVNDLLRDDPSLGAITVTAATERGTTVGEIEEMERELRRINLELAAYGDVFRPPGVGARDSRAEAPEDVRQQIALLEAKRARLTALRSDMASQEVLGTKLIAKSKGIPELDKEIRKALHDSYLSRFPGKIYILDICWAARQRHREWRRWLNGKLKDGCKPDKDFRAILESNKRPEEHRKEPRPKEWK